MSSEEIEVETDYFYTPQDQKAIDLASSPLFEEYAESLMKRAEEGEPLTHIIATAIISLFQPGFVVIGSPIMEPLEDGTILPDEVGIALSSSNVMTPSNLAVVLRKIADSIEEELKEQIERLQNDSN